MLSTVLSVDVLSESGSWAWLTFVGFMHLAWIAMCLWTERRARGARVETSLVEGRASIDGVVATDGDVQLGDAFVLVLPTGTEVRVLSDGRPRRAWEVGPQLRAGDAVSIDGVLAREAMDGEEDYRSSSMRWTLRPRSLRRIAEPDPIARTRRRATLAVWAGVLSVVVTCLASVEFVALSLQGETVDALIGEGGRVAEGDLRAQGHVDGPNGRLTFVEVMPADRLLPGNDAAVLPVVFTSLAGVRIAQIGAEPGLSRNVLYAGLAELMVAVFAFALLRRDASLIRPATASEASGRSSPE